MRGYSVICVEEKKFCDIVYMKMLEKNAKWIFFFCVSLCNAVGWRVDIMRGYGLVCYEEKGFCEIVYMKKLEKNC